MANSGAATSQTPGFYPTATLDTSAPVLTVPSGVQTVTEGDLSSTINLGSFTDDDSSLPSSNWVVIVNWGDGSPYAVIPEASYPSGGVLGSFQHTYAEYGNYTATVTVVDQAGNSSASQSISVHVADAALNQRGGRERRRRGRPAAQLCSRRHLYRSGRKLLQSQ